MPDSWVKAVAPVVQKCEIAQHFGGSLTFTRDGATALGLLVKDMAEKLDQAIADRERLFGIANCIQVVSPPPKQGMSQEVYRPPSWIFGD